MLLLQFIIIFANTAFLRSEDSLETRYIDLLPEKEKSDFINKIARRILEEVKPKQIGQRKSGEVADEQLNTQSDFVNKIIREEKDNLRRNASENSAKRVERSDPKDKKDHIDLTLREGIQDNNEDFYIDETNTEEDTVENDEMPVAENAKENVNVETVTAAKPDEKPENYSIEIEILQDKNNEHNVQGRQIPVKVVYDVPPTKNNTNITAAVPVVTEETTLIVSTTGSHLSTTNSIVSSTIEVNSEATTSTDSVGTSDVTATLNDTKSDSEITTEMINFETTVEDSKTSTGNVETNSKSPDITTITPETVNLDSESTLDKEITKKNPERAGKIILSDKTNDEDTNKESTSVDVQSKLQLKFVSDLLKQEQISYRRNLDENKTKNDTIIDDHKEHILERIVVQNATHNEYTTTSKQSPSDVTDFNEETTLESIKQPSSLHSESQITDSVQRNNNFEVSVKVTNTTEKHNNLTILLPENVNRAQIIELSAEANTPIDEKVADEITDKAIEIDSRTGISDNRTTNVHNLIWVDKEIKTEATTTAVPSTTFSTTIEPNMATTTEEEIVKARTEYVTGKYDTDISEEAKAKGTESTTLSTTTEPNMTTTTEEEIVKARTEYVTGKYDTDISEEAKAKGMESTTLSTTIEPNMAITTEEEIVKARTEYVTGKYDTDISEEAKAKGIILISAEGDISHLNHTEVLGLVHHHPLNTTAAIPLESAEEMSEGSTDESNDSHNLTSTESESSEKTDVTTAKRLESAEISVDDSPSSTVSLSTVFTSTISPSTVTPSTVLLSTIANRIAYESLTASDLGIKRFPTSNPSTTEAETFKTTTVDIETTTKSPSTTVKAEDITTAKKIKDIDSRFLVKNIVKESFTTTEMPILLTPKPIASDEIPAVLYEAATNKDIIKQENNEKEDLTVLRASRKDYRVYEILPGQDPFFPAKSLPRVKLMDVKDSDTTKMPEKAVGRMEIEQKSAPVEEKQKKVVIVANPYEDQPSYAPIYNYAPENAYYNPANRYGPDPDSREDTQIVYENIPQDSDEARALRNQSPKKIDKKVELRTQNEKDYIMLVRTGKNKELDYFFGLDTNKDEAKYVTVPDKKETKKEEVGLFRGVDGNKKELRNGDCSGTTSEEKVMRPFPNSNEAEHAWHAMLNDEPPKTQMGQVLQMLHNRNYFGNLYHKTTTAKDPTFTTRYPMIAYMSRTTTTKEPMNDTKETKVARDRTLRQRTDDEIRVIKPNTKISIQSIADKKGQNVFKVNDKTRPLLRELLKQTSQDVIDKSKKLTVVKITDKHKLKRLLSGKGLQLKHKLADRKPKEVKPKTMILLTGNPFIKDSGKLNSNDFISKMKYVEPDDSREELDLYDEIKKPMLRERPTREYEYYSDPADISSGDAEYMKTLNTEAIELVLNLTDTKHIYPILAKLNKLYSTNATNFRREMESDVEPYILVLRDMIKMDTENKALTEYDWLATTVDIRSGIQKLVDLSQRLIDGIFIHPKDLQMMKYVLYLFKSSRDLIEPSFLKALRNWRWRTLSSKSGRPKGPIKKRPWLVRPYDKQLLIDFENFLKEIEVLLNDLHNAIKHIGLVTTFRKQRWFGNLKELYLGDNTRKQALEVLLHLLTSNIIDLVESATSNGLGENYVKYAMTYKQDVKNTKNEFSFLVKVFNVLRREVNQ